MPNKKAHHHALARQWEILKQLPKSGSGLTARELTYRIQEAGFEATKRTIERDLTELSALFPLMRNDKGTPRGWHWMPGADADLPGLTLADALSLRIVEDLLRPLLPAAVLESLEPRFRSAWRKLALLAAANRNARWAGKVRYVPPALPLHPPAIAPGVLKTVQAALLLERQLDVNYRHPGADRANAIRLHPLGLVQRGPVTYLVATAFEYTDERLYAVHRIQAASLGDGPAFAPEGFTLDAYIDSGALHFGNGQTLGLEAWVSEELGAILAETPIAEDQSLDRAKDGYRLTATVTDSWQLRWWLLSQGEAVVVMQPEALRNDLVASLHALLGRYEALAPANSP